MRSTRTALLLAAILAVPLAACGGGDDNSAAPSSGTGVCATTKATGDLLAQVCDKGTLTASTDAAYPPQSKLDPKTNEYVGFDIDVATEIANRLGVDIAWETPPFEAITAGHWNGRWDMSVGSITITNERAKALHFTEPYYYTPAVAVVHESNTDITDLATDLDGKKIGACTACSYVSFMQKTLDIKGFTFNFVIDDPVISEYDTDTIALQDLALGDGTRLDAVLTSLTTAQGFAVDNPVKVVGDPLFYEPLAVAFDRSSTLDNASLFKAVDAIVGKMHADGTLTELSKKWYDGVDLSLAQ
jgi:polar amino acid transport system substrate-binding protein